MRKHTTIEEVLDYIPAIIKDNYYKSLVEDVSKALKNQYKGLTLESTISNGGIHNLSKLTEDYVKRLRKEGEVVEFKTLQVVSIGEDFKKVIDLATGHNNTIDTIIDPTEHIEVLLINDVMILDVVDGDTFLEIFPYLITIDTINRYKDDFQTLLKLSTPKTNCNKDMLKDIKINLAEVWCDLI